MSLNKFSAIYILGCGILGYALSQVYPNSIPLCVSLSVVATAVYLVLVRKYLKD